jgi:type I restriction enzyme M protein
VDNPNGQWRSFDYEELIRRDKVNLDIFWIKDESLEDSDSLPEPDVILQEIIEDLESALVQLKAISDDLFGREEAGETI